MTTAKTKAVTPKEPQKELSHISNLEEHLGYHLRSVSKLIERLLQTGQIESTGSESDRRCQLIYVTDSARQLVPKLAQLADDNDQYFFGVLAGDEQQQLKLLLDKLRTQQQLQTRPLD